MEVRGENTCPQQVESKRRMLKKDKKDKRYQKRYIKRTKGVEKGIKKRYQKVLQQVQGGQRQIKGLARLFWLRLRSMPLGNWRKPATKTLDL